ncbi:hypothetical protein NDU88_000055 [Pleurodeles waltl]|uniref:Uncharacterized protein n=1 Tax=Pleurodeles waltl TaxID=8319 RepID=A0AAV7SVU0_PLEWA|nr:hypothetical protein NDU88_000055 [Pleurodeles waltl]
MGTARAQEGPLGGGDRGGAHQHRKPMQKQAAPAEALEQAFKISEHSGRLNTTKGGPAKLEVNSASWAMQDGVLGTWAVLCTKEDLEKCTGALAAAENAVHRITVWRGEARAYLYQIWTEGPLDCRGYLDPASVFQGPRSVKMRGDPEDR